MFTEIEDASIAGIDLDACRNPVTGEVEAWAQEPVDRFDSYTEVSPSGTGLKVFFLIATADKAGADAIFGGQSGKQFKNGGGEHGPAIEIYRGRRYFTVTEDSIGPDELRPVDVADLRWLICEAGPQFAGQSDKANGKDESRSARAFRIGAGLKATGASYDEMRAALLEHEDPDIASWAKTKGLANDERELKRVYDKAGSDEPAVQLGDFVAFMQSRRLRLHARRRLLAGGRSRRPVGRRSRSSTSAASRSSTTRRARRRKCAPAPGSPNMRRSSN